MNIWILYSDTLDGFYCSSFIVAASDKGGGKEILLRMPA